MSRREKILALRNASPLVLPSMLLCDFSDLRAECGRLEHAGFRGLHLDVMDGVFVPNFSYGMTIVRAFRESTSLALDVHLMMTNPQDYIQQFHDAGADSITFHIEAVDDAAKAIDAIHELGMAAGIAIDCDTPVSSIADVAARCDIVLVMTIKAGFGGQKFIPDLLGKLAEVRQITGAGPVLQVDGGINQQTIGQSVQAGAEWLVVGSGVFKTDNYELAHQSLLDQVCLDQS
ncbi:MAG: ribulose-phosphate 3-epimerase [Pirellulaceae bacterium]